MLNNKRVLCLGNTSNDTEVLTSLYAKKHNSVNHGLIVSVDVEINAVGFYHTTLGDIQAEEILSLVKKFDAVVILNQPIETYNNSDLYRMTKQTAILIKNVAGIPVEIVEPTEIMSNVK
jgi:hypothetical protein